MPPEELETVTSEDRDRFDREHPDLPQAQAGEIPNGDTSTLEEREAARRQSEAEEAERQQHPEGRSHGEFLKQQHTADDQRRAKKLSQQKPCPQQKQ